MKILMLASYAPSLINFRGSLIKRLVDEGHEVIAVAPEIDDTLSNKLCGLGATPHQLALSRTSLDPLNDLRFCWQLYQFMRRVRPDLLFSYTIKPNIWGAFAAALANIPSIAMVTGLGTAFIDTDHRLSIKQRIVFAVAHKLYRWSSSLNMRIIFQNKDDLTDFMMAGCLRDTGKAALINGSGVDLTHFAPAAPVGKPVFLMISRLLNNKGVREYVEAAKRLRTRYPDACFRLVGPCDTGIDGISREELETWVAEGSIDYRGPAIDVRPHIAEAMVYVLPSYREGTPRSVLEAMAMGRPIITTDAPGCRETIREGVEGFLVPVRDSVALAAAMEKFLSDPALCICMGNKARERARIKYDVHRINLEMISLLTEDDKITFNSNTTRTSLDKGAGVS